MSDTGSDILYVSNYWSLCVFFWFFDEADEADEAAVASLNILSTL